MRGVTIKTGGGFRQQTSLKLEIKREKWHTKCN
jgi:hypothetical protein